MTNQQSEGGICLRSFTGEFFSGDSGETRPSFLFASTPRPQSKYGLVAEEEEEDK